jgi:hypothetical protein
MDLLFKEIGVRFQLIHALAARHGKLGSDSN